MTVESATTGKPKKRRTKEPENQGIGKPENRKARQPESQRIGKPENRKARTNSCVSAKEEVNGRKNKELWKQGIQK